MIYELKKIKESTKVAEPVLSPVEASFEFKPPVESPVAKDLSFFDEDS